MNGLVLSRMLGDGLTMETSFRPALLNYSVGVWMKYPCAYGSLMLCNVEADEADFQVMGLDPDVTVLWYETAEWRLQSAFAPEFVTQYHQYGLELGVSQDWLDAHIYEGRITQDAINDLVQYLEDTA